MSEIRKAEALIKESESAKQIMDIEERKGRLKLSSIQSDIATLHDEKIVTMKAVNKEKERLEELQKKVSDLEEMKLKVEREIHDQKEDIDREKESVMADMRKLTKERERFESHKELISNESKVLRNKEDTFKKKESEYRGKHNLLIREKSRLDQVEADLREKSLHLEADRLELSLKEDAFMVRADHQKNIINEAKREKELYELERKAIEYDKNIHLRALDEFEKDKSNFYESKARFEIEKERGREEIREAIRRQETLDRSIEALMEKETRLEIRELRVDKIIREKKDIKELQALRREVEREK